MREKKEHAQAVFDHLANEKNACEERIYEEEQRYRTLFNMRQKTLASIKVSIILRPFENEGNVVIVTLTASWRHSSFILK